ncbi:MAG: helix-hairpin-helix domain-containing protein, partial [Candidatus Hodarchaeales archaeon]
IARRLQDPLSELVKIDPRSIGVGQYQHDLTGLSKALKEVVIDTVNLVGVDVNTASEALLKYVSGISKSIAKSVIQYRHENGAFVYREDLKNVSGVGNRTYEQCAGFLRISGAPDPFDNSPIHPESYEIAERIIDFTEYSKEDLNTVEKRKQLQKQVKMLNPQYAAKKLGLEDKIETITDIISILQNPYRDPREDFDKPILKSSVLSIEDLEEGTIVEGTITNVTDFGCFVDLGVKTNGLIHISEISESFIRHPREAGLKIGDIVKPKIKEIDLIKKRISLTLKKSSPKRIKKNLFKDRSRSKSTKTIKKKKPETFEDKQISSLFKNGKIQL